MKLLQSDKFHQKNNKRGGMLVLVLMIFGVSLILISSALSQFLNQFFQLHFLVILNYHYIQINAKIKPFDWKVHISSHLSSHSLAIIADLSSFSFFSCHFSRTYRAAFPFTNLNWPPPKNSCLGVLFALTFPERDPCVGHIHSESQLRPEANQSISELNGASQIGQFIGSFRVILIASFSEEKTSLLHFF